MSSASRRGSAFLALKEGFPLAFCRGIRSFFFQYVDLFSVDVSSAFGGTE